MNIITGDLRIIRNNKLRKLICKGPNYREPKTINLKKCRDEIAVGLAEFVNKISSSFHNVRIEDMLPWQNKI